MSKYTYIFVRQDLSLEQQMVQSGHACLLLGTKYPDIDAQSTNFVLVGVRNEDGLFAVERILKKFEINYVRFIEPDIGDQATAIATIPMDRDQRGPLLAFNVLKV